MADIVHAFDDGAAYELITVRLSPVVKVIRALPERDSARLIEAVRAGLPAGRDGSIACAARANAIKARVRG